MTSSPSLLVQPGFDARIRRYASPFGTGSAAGLQRGFMIWDAKGGNLGYQGGPHGDGRDMIQFLYNPSTISTDYNVANGSLQFSMMYPMPGNGSTPPIAPLQQSVQWQLYFDRTFELNYGSGSGTGKGQSNDPGVIGVQADVLQFMQFTGVLYQDTQSLGNVLSGSTSGAVNAIGSAITTSYAALGAGGICMMIPSWVYFGNAAAVVADASSSSTNYAATALQLAFYGFIQEWSVQYTHFTEAMIPIRAVVSVSFTMLPNASTSTTAIAQDIAGNTTWVGASGDVRAPGTVASNPGAAGVGGT